MTFNILSRICHDQSVMLQCPEVPHSAKQSVVFESPGYPVMTCLSLKLGMQTTMGQLRPGLYPAIVLLTWSDDILQGFLILLIVVIFLLYLRFPWSSKWPKNCKEMYRVVMLWLMLGGPAYGDSSGSYLSAPSRNALSGPL